MLTIEQVAAAQKAQIATLLGLTATSFDAAEKLAVLNLDVAKAAFGEASAKAKAALGAKDVQELAALQGDLLQPSTDKAAAYGRQVYDIVAAVQVELNKVAEAGAADAQKKFLALVENAVKNAPAGTENAVTLAKAAVAAANDAYESVQKATKQAVGAAEANFTSLSAAVAKSAPTGAKSKRAA